MHRRSRDGPGGPEPHARHLVRGDLRAPRRGRGRAPPRASVRAFRPENRRTLSFSAGGHEASRAPGDGGSSTPPMLRFFRSSGIGQGVMAANVVLIIAVFALEFRTGSGSPTSALKEQCAISYAGNCVDSKDYFAAVGLIAERVAPKQSRAMSLRRRILDGLAERELLYEAAKKLDLGVSDEAIEQEIMAGRAYVSLPADEADMLAFQLGLCRRAEMGYGCEPGSALGVRQLHVRRTPDEPFDYNLYQKSIRVITNRGPKEFRGMQERELVAERMRELV